MQASKRRNKNQATARHLDLPPAGLQKSSPDLVADQRSPARHKKRRKPSKYKILDIDIVASQQQEEATAAQEPAQGCVC